MANVLDCDIVVRGFKVQSHYCLHFRTVTLGEKYEPPYISSYELDSTTTVLLKGWLRHEIIHESLYAIKQRNQPNLTSLVEKKMTVIKKKVGLYL